MGPASSLASGALANRAAVLRVEGPLDAQAAEAMVAREAVGVLHRVQADAALQLLAKRLEQLGVAREARRIQLRVEALQALFHASTS